ncbi:hypothetical protein IPC432_08250 [Pseudomonas aeruginosa]|nr:hypothetical protein AO887_30770 [Pseudomonas aeruginosa]RUI36292.1 hypothetical protein IPC432_08250 [Pseudomonas aeruginosa]
MQRSRLLERSWRLQGQRETVHSRLGRPLSLLLRAAQGVNPFSVGGPYAFGPVAPSRGMTALKSCVKLRPDLSCSRLPQCPRSLHESGQPLPVCSPGTYDAPSSPAVRYRAGAAPLAKSASLPRPHERVRN